MDGFGNGTLCDGSDDLCWSGDNGSGGVITSAHWNPDNAELMQVDTTTQCASGTVSESCPFTEGCGLNAYFAGNAIVTLANNANQLSYLSSGGQIIEQKTGSGQLWVQVGSFENNHYGLLINVLASDKKCAFGTVPDVACYAESGIAAGNALQMFCQDETKTIHITDSWDWTDLGN